jgi:aminoglycoside phosphotransferase (APT) family kinase protein
VRTGKHLRLVDWEMAMWGDPAWDLATLLSEYLSLWIDHAPVSEATPPEQFLAHGVFTLDRLQPSIRGLWEAYRDARTGSEPAGLLWERAVRFSAARLVQTAYETSQYLNDLSGQVVFKLQLAHNILTDPITASTVLLGIPAGGEES